MNRSQDPDIVVVECKPEDYPFKDFKQGQACSILDIPENKRHLYCDRNQLNAENKYRTPKINADMIKAKIKEREDSLNSFPIVVEHAREQEKKVKEQEKTIESLTSLLAEQQEKFTDYQLLMEERMNKLASMMMNMQSMQQEQKAPEALPPMQRSYSSVTRQKSTIKK